MFYRVNVIELRVPSLRERPEDVQELAEAVLRRLGRRMKITPPMLGKDALQALQAYAFPGNVRELENILERAITLSTSGEISAPDIQLRPTPGTTTSAVSRSNGEALGDHLEEIERDAILKALEQTRYNKTAAAKVLGMSFRALRYRIKNWESNDAFAVVLVTATENSVIMLANFAYSAIDHFHDDARSDPRVHRLGPAVRARRGKFEHGNKTMIRNWFNAREATEIGIALADQYARQRNSTAIPHGAKTAKGQPTDPLQDILDRAGRELHALRLNFYKRAKFANSFKWRLLEKGVERDIADKVTEKLVLHVSLNQTGSTQSYNDAGPADQPQPRNARSLLAQGNKCVAQGEYSEAIAFYQEVLALNPRHPEALNNLGATFYKLGRYTDAEEVFRRTIRIYPDFADANSNLGILLRCSGRVEEAEVWLRRAIKINPKHVEARSNLGLAFVFFGRLSEAKAQFKKALKFAPRNDHTLFGMGHLASDRRSLRRG